MWTTEIIYFSLNTYCISIFYYSNLYFFNFFDFDKYMYMYLLDMSLLLLYETIYVMLL